MNEAAAQNPRKQSVSRRIEYVQSFSAYKI